ncbi:MAG: YigZ family protein [Clostridia bacterium]|nr:YigZ family protein [Clostridia bacterium]
MQPYKVPAAAASAEVSDRRSRFIGQVWPVSEPAQAAQTLEALRKAHYQARHVVYAVRLHAPETARFSDDGEPQGTAGPPLLELLRRADMTDCLLTVVRYFGGVLLGTGGLLRAYTAAGQQALAAAGEAWKVPAVSARLTCSYTAYGRIAALPAACGGEAGTPVYAETVSLPVRIPALCAGALADDEIWRETGTPAPVWTPADPICLTKEEYEKKKELFLKK